MRKGMLSLGSLDLLDFGGFGSHAVALPNQNPSTKDAIFAMSDTKCGSLASKSQFGT
jgi:hypothetical protein